MAFHESNTRSIIKAITFRFIILCSDAVVVFTVTHNYNTTLNVILISNLASTVLYFFHERAWNTIHWGKKKLAGAKSEGEGCC